MRGRTILHVSEAASRPSRTFSRRPRTGTHCDPPPLEAARSRSGSLSPKSEAGGIQGPRFNSLWRAANKRTADTERESISRHFPEAQTPRRAVRSSVRPAGEEQIAHAEPLTLSAGASLASRDFTQSENGRQMVPVVCQPSITNGPQTPPCRCNACVKLHQMGSIVCENESSSPLPVRRKWEDRGP